VAHVYLADGPQVELVRGFPPVRSAGARGGGSRSRFAVAVMAPNGRSCGRRVAAGVGARGVPSGRTGTRRRPGGCHRRVAPTPRFFVSDPKEQRKTNESVPIHAIATSWCDRRHGRMRHVLGSDPKNVRRTGESVPNNARRLGACRVKTQPFSDGDARGRACVALFYRWITRVAMEPLAGMQAEHGELDRPIVGAS
jgi:hypothetical protein